MSVDQPSRREFVHSTGAALSSAFLLMHAPALERVAARALRAEEQGAQFAVLTPEEARAVEAVSSLIIPSDDGRPGAREAGVVRFVDQMMESLEAPNLGTLRSGLSELDATAEANGFTGPFADQSVPNQQAVLGAFVDEQPGLFGYLRYLTICGMFAMPSYGGNQDGVGFELVELDLQPRYSPPFGYYDAQVIDGRDAP